MSETNKSKTESEGAGQGALPSMEMRTGDMGGRFCVATGAFAHELGIASVTEGRIFGLLFLADAPMSQDDLMAQLGISRGNVSKSVRTLIEAGFVVKVWKRGDRREHYQVGRDLWRATTGRLLARISRQTQRVRDEFELMHAEAKENQLHGISPDIRRNSARIASRIAYLLRFLSLAEDLTGVVQRLVLQSAVPPPED